MSSDPVVLLDGVSKLYRQYRTPGDRLKSQLFGKWVHSKVNEFKALEDISLSLGRGESLGIVGLNGAGKSTLLQLLAGTIQPTTGKVQVRGRIAALLELGSGFNPEFTGLENVYLNAAILGLSRQQTEEALDGIIEFSGLGDHIHQPVKTYSTGMYVRLAFSVATSVKPDILIIDEALSVGDGAFAKKSFDRIMRIKKEGASILFCSHALFHVDVFCDRTLWLQRGKTQALGPTAQVLPLYQDFLEGLSAGDTSSFPREPRPAQPQSEARFLSQPHPVVLGDGAFSLDSIRSGQTESEPAQHAGTHLGSVNSDNGIDRQSDSEDAIGGSAHGGRDLIDRARTIDTLSNPAQELNQLPLQHTPSHPGVRLQGVRVLLDGVEGTELKGRSALSTLVMEVMFSSPPNEPAPRAALVISSEQGRILGTSLSPPDSGPDLVIKRQANGRGIIQVSLDNIPLNKGRYCIGAYLVCDAGHFVHDWTDPCAHISLDYDGPHQGPFLLPAAWGEDLLRLSVPDEGRLAP